MGRLSGWSRLMATLYRCSTPTNWLCPCGRVARELAKAGVQIDEVRVGLRRSQRPELEALSGQRAVPVVVPEDGEPICDSRRIVEHLRFRAGVQTADDHRGPGPR